MSKRRGLLINTLAQAGVRLLGSACALVLTWLVARDSVHELGVFRTLFVYFLIGEFIPLLGMQTYLFREISVHPEQTKRYTLHAGLFSLGVSLVAMLVLAALSFFGGYSEAVSKGLLWVALGLPATAASLVGVSVLVGSGKASQFSLIQGVETLVRTGLGMVAIYFGWGVLTVIALFVLSRWLVLIPYWRALRSLWGDEPWAFDRSFFRAFLNHVPTFAGITLLSLVARFAAQALLPTIMDDVAAGQFAAAFVFVDLLLLVPTSLSTNLVPIMARKANEAGEAFSEACNQGLKLMVLGVLPLAAVLAAVARPLFETVLPGRASYAVSAQVLEILIFSTVLQAADQVLSAAQISRRRQDLDFKTVCLGAVSVLALLLVLLPLCGVRGAAIAVCSAQLLSLAWRYWLTRKIMPGLHLGSALLKPVLAASAAAATAWYLSAWHWIPASVAGGLVYLAILALLGAFSASERAGVARLLQTGRNPS